MLGRILVIVIEAVSLIIIARFLGSTTYGRYTIAMIPITFAQIFTDLGVRNGLIKYITQFRSENKLGNVSNLIKMAFFINTSIGILLTIITYFFASYIAGNVFNQPDITLFIQIASINLVATSIFRTANGVMIGFERMDYLSIMIIIQSILKVFLSPILVYIGFGALGAIVGYTASLTLAALIGLLAVLYLLRSASQYETTMNFSYAGNLLFSYGFPIFISVILSGLLAQVLNFMMGLYINPTEIGNYRAALNFNVFISFLTLPISTVLFPLFSKIDLKEKNRLKNIYQNAVKYISLLTIPIVFGLILLSEPIVNIVYGTNYSLTAKFLQLNCITFLPILYGAQVTGSVLLGQGKTKVIIKSSTLSLCIGVILGWYLIPRFGISGLILTNILNQGVLIHNLYWIKKNLEFTFNYKISAKIFLSACIPFFTIYFLFTMIPLQGWTKILLAGGSFILTYLYMILKTKTITLEDIKILKQILGSVGPLTPIFNIFLDFFEKYLTSNP